MSDKYKIVEHEKAHFLTLTVVGWIDVFTRKNHKLVIIDSLKYCQRQKDLSILGWCLMPSQLQLIARAEGRFTLSEIIRDFKKYTAKKIVSQIEEEPESRREWMLDYFHYTGKPLKRIKKYKFWQDGNQAKVIYSPSFFYEKLNFIHQNPVDDLIVANPEDYLFSSARNYAELDNLLEIELETQQMINVR
jgi:REP element-mobilizing transposase RayT